MIKAVIFDMDGVIINNTPYHVRAWEVFAEQYNLELLMEKFKQELLGISTESILKQLFGQDLSQEKIAKYTSEKDSIYFEIYKENISAAEGLLEFIDLLKEKNITMGVATSETKEIAHSILQKVGVKQYFKVIVTGDDVENLKPNSEPYLTAAEGVGETPADCMAIEDTPSGIQSAKGAGMKVIGITTTYPSEKLSEADVVVKDFTELTLEKINSLA